MFRMRIGLRFVASAPPSHYRPCRGRTWEIRHEVSGQALGSFVKKTTAEGIEHKATHSGGVLGSYRFYFSSRSRRPTAMPKTHKATALLSHGLQPKAAL